VRGFFISNNNFKLHPAVATVIAQIACHNNSLPQGSPCSPIISDLITHAFDMRVIKLMKKYKCTYSRYADDLTISTNRIEFPKQLAYQFEDGSSAWIPGKSILDVFNRSGFSFNHKKTRMQYRGSRQLVTGLIVNKKVNVRAEYYRAARSMCRSLFEHGYFYLPSLNGPPPAGKLAQLEGVINHIYYIKHNEKVRTKVIPRDSEYHGIELLYRRFLAFKKFVALKKLLILTEGKTDNIYLRAAIRRLTKYRGTLTTIVGGKAECAVSLFEHSDITRTVLGLDGGSSYIPPFLHSYEKIMREFNYAPILHPVIILIDNDSGADKIFAAMRQLKLTVNNSSTAPFYQIKRNLYVIKTPELAPIWTSQIEDLFDAKTLSATRNGKKFNKANDVETTTEYGKSIFCGLHCRP
jgi:hypothetical protein